MASWSENSSYQGAASGAAAGSVGGVYGAAAGAAIGFVAGGLMGGAQEDAARKAEEDRQKEIQRAIERQNTKDFNAKAQAEHWAMSDIGINKEDQALDARAETAGLKKNVKRADAEIARLTKRRDSGGSDFEQAIDKIYYQGGIGKAKLSADIAKKALTANEGILANYENDMGAPKKY